MKNDKSIGKLYYDVEISVNCKKDLTHREKMDKLIDELDYLNTAEIESLLKTAETFKIKNEIGIIPTKDLVEELKKRMGVETLVVGVEGRYLLHLICPEFHGIKSEDGPATILIVTD